TTLITNEISEITIFQDFLTTRLIQIKMNLSSKIKGMDEHNDLKSIRNEYYKNWKMEAEELLKQTLCVLDQCGLDNFPLVRKSKIIGTKPASHIDLRGANCALACFNGADLIGASFEGANCSCANFDFAICAIAQFSYAVCECASFIYAECPAVDFFEARCCGSHFDGAHCTETVFLGANCSHVSFGTKERLMQNGDIERVPCGISRVSFNERSNFIGVDTSNVDWSKNPRLKRFIEHQQMVEGAIGKNWFTRYIIPGGVWWLFADYGRSIFRWFAWFIAFILAFGIGFAELWDQFAYKSFPPDWSTFPYFSIVTISTLGFGDITPLTGNARLLVCAEVIIGYIMLGGLVTFLANWLGRR
ncbi:MAG TPA: hypothetical protein ENN07_04125, partial [candidate division Zixibacteria bacterium]|nr:hypothetical protein [candidate division Zixibacteria bacterium]